MQQITLTFTSASLSGIIEQMEAFIETANPTSDPVSVPSGQPVTETHVEEKPKGKRGRKPKVQVAPEPEQEPEEPAEVEDFNPADSDGDEDEATIVEAKAALSAVLAKGGLSVAKAILAKFGAGSLSMLKTADYSKFIKACNEYHLSGTP